MVLPVVEVKVTADTAQATANVDKFTDGLNEIPAASKRADAATKSNTAALKNMSAATLLSGNRSRMLTQQLSQVAQQSVATGQPIQALAVQAADIGLAFGTVGTIVGALAGIALPTLIAALSNTSGQTDILEGELEQLSDAGSRADNILQTLRLTADQLVETYGRGAQIVREFSIAQAELLAGQIERRLRDQIGLVATLSEEYTRATRGTVGNIAAIRRDFSVTTEQAKILRAELSQLGNADTFEKQQQELGDILSLLQEMDVDLSKIPPDLNSALQEMISLGVETERVRNLMSQLRAESAGVTTGVPLFEQALGPGGLLPPGPSGGGGGGRGKTDPNEARLEALVKTLQTERELVEQFRAEGLELLASASEAELEALGGINEAKLRLEEEYQNRLAGIKQKGRETDLSMTLGAGAEVLGALGQFNDKALKLAKVAGAAQALVSTLQGSAEALKLPYPYNLVAAATVAAKGLSLVAAIKGVSSSGGGGAAGGGGTASDASAATPSQSPLDVRLSGLGPGDSITGSQLSGLFDRLQDEAGDRGLNVSFAT